ncbi:hypothetical protein A2U01_0103224, partial [Trifolium medium]|nr:hypothetical protein [Trifolium medium]
MATLSRLLSVSVRCRVIDLNLAGKVVRKLSLSQQDKIATSL